MWDQWCYFAVTTSQPVRGVYSQWMTVHSHAYVRGYSTYSYVAFTSRWAGSRRVFSRVCSKSSWLTMLWSPSRMRPRFIVVTVISRPRFIIVAFTSMRTVHSTSLTFVWRLASFILHIGTITLDLSELFWSICENAVLHWSLDFVWSRCAVAARKMVLYFYFEAQGVRVLACVRWRKKSVTQWTSSKVFCWRISLRMARCLANVFAMQRWEWL